MDIMVHRLAKIRKLDPLYVDYSPTGKMRVRVWKRGCSVWRPNAIAMEDIAPGSKVQVDGSSPGVFEVRKG